MLLIPLAPKHVQTLAEIAAETFTDTFGHLYSAEDLNSYLAAAYAHPQLLHEIATEECYFLCLDTDPEGLKPLGFAQLRPNTRNELMRSLGDEYPEPCWELHRFYIRKESQGMRAGSFMMDFCMKRFKEAGVKSLWLSVYSDNVKAQKFYQKYGITYSGHNMEFPVGNHVDLEFLYTAKFSF
ncbi:hypothetical protein HDU78_010890 [Chytriomyces hyalinus]|nr:hypothetical protein HDU78_010890 [Chytriomyces hyalinus]